MTFESSYHVRVKTLYKALCVRHCQGSKNKKKKEREREKQTKIQQKGISYKKYGKPRQWDTIKIRYTYVFIYLAIYCQVNRYSTISFTEKTLDSNTPNS